MMAQKFTQTIHADSFLNGATVGTGYSHSLMTMGAQRLGAQFPVFMCSSQIESEAICKMCLI